MTVTNCIIALDIESITIKNNATFNSSGIVSFGDLTDLKNDTASYNPFATFEPNFWLLNGRYKFAPNSNAHGGYVSDVLGQSDGTFLSPPTLTITFGSVHSSDDLTIRSSELIADDYINDVDIAYYDISDNLIRTDNYTPTGREFSTGQVVDDFKKIVITFNSISTSYRRVRITSMDFDTVIRFSGSDVRNAKLIEEINPISTSLPSNSLEFSLYSSDGGFSIINPGVAFEKLKDREPFNVYETVDGVNTHIGKFYINRRDSKSENVANFEAIDETRLLDEKIYYDTIVQYILDGEVTLGFLIDYTIDMVYGSDAEREIATELFSINAYGWLKGGISFRSHLCKLAFVGGAYITCSRSGKILVKMKPSDYELIETKINDDHEDITYTGTWTNWESGSAYMGDTHGISGEGESYLTYSFTGVRFKLGMFLDFSPAYNIGKFFVSIDGGNQIEITKTGDAVAVSEWVSPFLHNGPHTVVITGWLADNGEEEAHLHIDYITKVEYSVLDLSGEASLISADRKGLGSSIEQLKLVTGVEVVAHNYVYNNLGAVKIYEAYLEPGTYMLTFEGGPYFDFTVSTAGGSQGTDWVEVIVNTAQTVTVTAKKYSDSKTIFGIYNNDLPEGTPRNVVVIDDVSLITPDNANDIAFRVYDYYQNRYKQKTRLFVPEEIPGDIVIVDSHGGQIMGTIEKMVTDLSGGFISDVDIVGKILEE